MIEKILAVDEALEPTLPVAGTTGYDALREIGGLFVDPTGRQALTELVGFHRRRLRRGTPVLARHSRPRPSTDDLHSESGSAVRAAIAAATGADHPDVGDASPR